jgi:hypothetical protein
VWRVVGLLIAALVALSLLGFLVRAVKGVLVLALALAVVAALAGMWGRRGP